MGTVPAPNIAQNALEQQQVTTNSMAEYARAAQEKQQTALSAQQTQEAALKNQQSQIAVQDQQAGLAALKDPTFKSMNDLPDLLQKHGASFNAITSARSNVLDYNTKLQTYTSDQLKNEGTKNDVVAGHIDTVKSLPPDQQPAAFENSKTDLVQRGYMTPQEAQQMPYPGPAGLDALETMHMAHSAQVEQQLKQSQSDEADAKARAENATAAHAEFVNKLTTTSKPGDFDAQIDAMLPPSGQTAGQNHYTKTMVDGVLKRGDLPGAQKIMDDAFQSVNTVNKDVAVATDPRVQAGKVDVAKNTALAKQQVQQGAPISIPAGATGEAALANLDPSTSAAVRMIGDGKADFSTFTQRTTADYRKQLAAAVTAYNPNFDQNTFKVRGAEEKGYTSGSQGQQLTAIGTARNHMQTFKDTADALDNDDFLKANQVGNYLGMQFGSDKATNFNIAKSAFAGEVGKAFAGANVGVSDRQELMDKISAASSPGQLKGYADTADELLAGKQKSLKQSYDAGVQGKPNFGGANGQTQGGGTQPSGSTKYWDKFPIH
jgi:hypothetical protein